MDLLYSERFDGFCIVSSDSDFTRLASRVREAGLFVYGFGEKKTPQAFVSACDKFIYTEILRTAEQENEVEAGKNRKTTKQLRSDARLVSLLRSALDAAADETGWAHLSRVGNRIVNQAPEFDSRNYGYKKLSDLVEATQLFDIDVRKVGDEGRSEIYVRAKRR
jgi:uncharacterized LabA/DUF88 family protein